MNKGHDGYRVVPYPKLDRALIDWMDLMHRKHMIHALVEVDITRAREEIRAYRARSEEQLSLTAYLTGCLARSVSEDTWMHAYRKGKNQLVLFDDVDVALMVEREVEGRRNPVVYIVRSANKKSYTEIDEEIRTAKVGKNPQAVWVRWMPLWLLLPSVLRKFIWVRLLSNPYRRKRITGTVTLTALGMFAKGTGWGVPLADHNLCLTLGGISRKPGVVDEPGPGGETIAIREYLCMTLSVDHDIIDGAPAARFIGRLKEMIEEGRIEDVEKANGRQPVPGAIAQPAGAG